MIYTIPCIQDLSCGNQDSKPQDLEYHGIYSESRCDMQVTQMQCVVCVEQEDLEAETACSAKLVWSHTISYTVSFFLLVHVLLTKQRASMNMADTCASYRKCVVNVPKPEE